MTMEWATLVVGLIGGALGTAVLTVSHERAERFRDRQFEAASRFIADYEEALNAIVDLWEGGIDLDEALHAVRNAAGPASEAMREAVGVDDLLDELYKAINVGLDLVGRSKPESAAEEISRSRAVIEQAIENLSGRMDEPFASTHRELLRSLQDMPDALTRFLNAARESRVGLHRVVVRVAQLNLLFAGKDAEVVEAARQVAEQLVAITSRVLSLGMELVEKDESRDDTAHDTQEASDGVEDEDVGEGISDEIQVANQLLADYAALANARVRPRPLVRDLLNRARGENF